MKLTAIAIAFAIALLHISSYTNAQTFEIIKDKAIGTIGYDKSPQLISLNNKELLLACSTSISIDGDKTDPLCDTSQILYPDIWLIKLDSSLNIIWNKSIGGAYEEAYPRISYDTITGHIFLICLSNSDSSCYKTSTSYVNSNDFWLVELDSLGNILKDNRYGGFNNEDNPSVLLLPNSERYICGSSNSMVGGDKNSANHSNQNDFWLIKTDSSGNKIWDKSIGGSGSEQCTNGVSLVNNNCLIYSSSDNSLYLNGTTTSPQDGDISYPQLVSNPNFWICKLDTSGTIIWDRRYSGKMSSCITTKQNHENGFIFGTHGLSGFDMVDSNNTINHPNIWIMKIDSLGNKVWDNFYGGNGNPINGLGSQESNVTNIVSNIDGSYLISSTTNNDIGFDISESTYGMQDYWLLKIDSNGNKLWDKRFGGSKNDYCAGFVQMPDSSIYIYGMSDAGGVTSMKTDSGHFYTDIWIVHFKYHDTTTVTSVNSNFEFEQGIKLFPNPATNFCTVQSSKERINSVMVYNTVGELIDEIRSPSATSIQIPLASYAPGLYFATIKSEHHIVTKKLIIRN